MKNADIPAMPVSAQDYKDNGGHECGSFGLTKREQFCLKMGVAETGDKELDAIIRKGNNQKFAAMAMQGIMANSNCSPTTHVHYENIAKDAITVADTLLEELENDR